MNTTRNTLNSRPESDHSSTIEARSFAGAHMGTRKALPSAKEPPASLVSFFAFFARVARGLAAQDWMITAYFVAVLCALVFGSGPGRGQSAVRVGIDLAILWAGLIVVRGELLRPNSLASGLIYRASVFGTVVLSYFQLRDILPAVTTRALDSAILSFDLRVFGFEPSLAWDHLVTPTTTEWFAFFYFSYFFLMVSHSVAFLLFVRDRDLVARFSMGIFGLFCVAHVVYMIMPGFGPYQALAGSFHNKLTGGFFWRMTLDTVQAGGAMKDIFPSLHTAAPTYFTVFAFMHRDRKVFKFLWPVLALFTSQIIIATMFLRWHYFIDIFAGLTLASCAAFAAFKVGAWEKRRREQMGIPGVYEPLPLPTAFPLPLPLARRARAPR